MASLWFEAGTAIARIVGGSSCELDIDDELRALAERAPRLRQEAITAELLDVITGADAVRGAGGSS